MIIGWPSSHLPPTTISTLRKCGKGHSMVTTLMTVPQLAKNRETLPPAPHRDTSQKFAGPDSTAHRRTLQTSRNDEQRRQMIIKILVRGKF